MCLDLSDLSDGVFCVFMEFRSDLHLILDWMTARGWFFDLLTALKILRVDQFPIKRTDLNLNFLKKSQERHPLVIFEKVRISQTHAFLHLHFPYFYICLKKINL